MRYCMQSTASDRWWPLAQRVSSPEKKRYEKLRALFDGRQPWCHCRCLLFLQQRRAVFHVVVHTKLCTITFRQGRLLFFFWSKQCTKWYFLQCCAISITYVECRLLQLSFVILRLYIAGGCKYWNCIKHTTIIKFRIKKTKKKEI